MRRWLRAITVCAAATACAATGFEPWLNHAVLDGMSVSRGGEVVLSGYELALNEGASVKPKSCIEAEAIPEGTIAEVDYQRYRSLLGRCRAIQWSRDSRPSLRQPFPTRVTAATLASLPATVVPLLADIDGRALAGMTVGEAFADSHVLEVRNEAQGRLASPTEEIWLTVMARGDVNADGSEDLLILSEWFATDAFGEHVDLVAVEGQSPGEVRILWRMGDE